MSEALDEARQPGIKVYRPVTQVEPGWYNLLSDRLNQENHLETEEIEAILEPARQPSAVLINPLEYARLTKAVERTVATENLPDLGRRLYEALPPTAHETRQIPVDPIAIARSGINRYAFLKIGRTGDLNKERAKLKKALANYFNLPWVPSAAGIWTREDRRSGINVARARDKQGLALIEGLRLAIKREKFFPEQIELGPVEVELTS